MRYQYPVSSQELNNSLLLAYDNLVYLLGQSIDDQSRYSGLYDRLETSGDYLSDSGIMDADNEFMITLLKKDYFYRQNNGKINYGS